MKAVYLACGLLMAGHAVSATTTGSIGVRLTLYSQCHIDGRSAAPAKSPLIACGQRANAQPKVTQTRVAPQMGDKTEVKLITIEW